MAQPLGDHLATRVRGLLRKADHPAAATGTLPEWRARRDRWLDALDPTMPAELGGRDIQQLIDFLSESGPNKNSRMTTAEWSQSVDALVPELLFSVQKAT